MRRPVFLPAVLLALALAAGAWAQGKTVSIQVRKGEVREKPTYLSKVLASPGYGESLINLGQQDDWIKVKTDKGVSGWVHKSAVTEKKIVLGSGKSQAQLKASNEELILAGKGFNKEVEQKYRSENPKAAFDRVDRAEKENNLGFAQITAFLDEGQLKPLNLELKAEKKAAPSQSGGGNTDAGK